MNRPIKFRCWFITENRWLTHNEFAIDSLGGILKLQGIRTVGYIDNECIITQFTGLADVDGNEIFEGDILIDNGMDKALSKVRWDSDHSCFQAIGIGKNKNILKLYEPIYKLYFKVFSNIFESPELLEGE